jgi:hypothetical protein
LNDLITTWNASSAVRPSARARSIAPSESRKSAGLEAERETASDSRKTRDTVGNQIGAEQLAAVAGEKVNDLAPDGRRRIPADFENRSGLTDQLARKSVTGAHSASGAACPRTRRELK